MHYTILPFVPSSLISLSEKNVNNLIWFHFMTANNYVL